MNDKKIIVSTSKETSRFIDSSSDSHPVYAPLDLLFPLSQRSQRRTIFKSQLLGQVGWIFSPSRYLGELSVPQDVQRFQASGQLHQIGLETSTRSPQQQERIQRRSGSHADRKGKEERDRRRLQRGR